MSKEKDTKTKKELVDIKRLETLIDLFEKRGLSELEIEDSELRIRLKKGPVYQVKKEKPEKQKTVQQTHINKNIHTIKSPMVGTYYHSPSPALESFVKNGDMVENGQVICIIEAMKIMNEIESDIRGKVVSILIEDGHPVEFGEPLFLIEPM